MFISSVDVEDLLIPRAAYIRGISQFLEHLSQRYDRVLFKLHPRNNPELIDELLRPFDGSVVRICEPVNCPVELCFNDFGAEAVAGSYSSPLLYLPMLHDVRSISAIPLLINTAREMGLLTERHSASAHRFVTAFSNRVEMVDLPVLTQWSD